jgi:hypothetical protein
MCLAKGKARAKAVMADPVLRQVVAKSAGEQRPDDVLSEKPDWQIPGPEILDRAAIPFLRFRDPLTLLFGSF